MNELAMNLDEFVDLETGEILLTDDSAECITEDLPKITRSLRALERRMGVVDKFRQDELARIATHCNRKIETFQRSHDYLMGLAEWLMRKTGEKRLEYPGLGVLKFGTTRESVNDEDYEAMSPEDQQHMRALIPKLFRTKIIVSPDKKAIMAELKDNVPVCGFFINPKRETFGFKAEA